MTLRSAFLAVPALAAAGWAGSVLIALPAHAQPFDGFYVGLGAGLDFLNDIGTTSAPPQALNVPSANIVSTNPGWGVLGSAGYGFGNGFRIEVEGNYRQNQTREWKGTPFPTTSSGTNQQYGAMLNALFDFDIGYNWLYPYMGAGVGWAQTRLGNPFTSSNRSLPFLLSTDETSNSLAWQVIVGASFPMPGVPGLSLTAEWRYYSVTGLMNFPAESVQPGASGVPVTARGNWNVKAFNNNSVLFGVRYAFNVTPPPPPPAPAPAAAPTPAPSRTYLVFFDWDKADLNDRARQIIAEAAQNSTRVQYTRIEVSGHADRTGGAEYNMRLSRRRAENVAGELVRLGVPKTAISIQAFGFTRPLVPTAAGVREPQNRRVEIVIK
jgi:outer membrane protein OmpA-like peptidoglycan-associated protein